MDFKAFNQIEKEIEHCLNNYHTINSNHKDQYALNDATLDKLLGQRKKIVEDLTQWHFCQEANKHQKGLNNDNS